MDDDYRLDWLYGDEPILVDWQFESGNSILSGTVEVPPYASHSEIDAAITEQLLEHVSWQRRVPSEVTD